MLSDLHLVDEYLRGIIRERCRCWCLCLCCCGKREEEEELLTFVVRRGTLLDGSGGVAGGAWHQRTLPW